MDAKALKTGIQKGPKEERSCIDQSLKDVFDRGTMAKITFVDSGGTERAVEAKLGSTVMEAAIRHSVPGIEAECGGACSCATCHVYVDEEWMPKVGKPGPMEEDMLDFAFEAKPNSRLSCQIKMTDALDGIIVRTPAKQA